MILDNKLLNNKFVKEINLDIIPANVCFNIETDSRQIKSDSLFIALEGERFDAFDFIDEKLCSRCAGIVYKYTKEREEKLRMFLDCHSELLAIGVSDPTDYLQLLAHDNLDYWVKHSDGKKIAITGSNGKTTNKDMVTHILSYLFPQQVHSTWKNYNNHIGVPLTLLSLEHHHRFLVLEMGTNHPGEIEDLCKIAHPSSGYITNIGDSHLEFFHNRENVFVEKSSLYDACKQNRTNGSVFIINNDDPYLSTLKKEDFCKTVGEDSNNDYFLEIKNSSLKVRTSGRVYYLENKRVIGRHNYRNFGMAMAIVNEMTNVEMDKIVEAAGSFIPNNNRSELHYINQQIIFLDAYNANPSSMRHSISSFVEFIDEHNAENKSTLFVIGDMNELGSKAESAHKDLARFIDDLRRQCSYSINIAYVGRYGKEFSQGLKNHEGVEYYENRESLSDGWDQCLSNYMFLFIKASRSLQLESLIGINKG